MVRHGKTLEYQVHPDDPWQGVGVFTEYVFSHCVWCYDSQYTPEPLRDNNPPIFPQEHFLKWVTIHRPQTYNELLREYNDFCKDNPELMRGRLSEKSLFSREKHQIYVQHFLEPQDIAYP
jgi:hypothetical protein